MTALHSFFASAPLGSESALADELEELGAQRVAAMPRGVAFDGDMQLGYRSLLWSRIASRILLRLAQGKVERNEDLDALVRSVSWEQHLRPDASFRVIARAGAQSVITDARYLTQRVKDNIVDQFRERYGRRPDVERDDPALTVHVHLGKTRAQISIDFGGQALHRRGYRQGTGAAPIKEHLAAAILRRAGWHRLHAQGLVLLDPCCGSGTFLCEAFCVATKRAAALGQRDLALFRWEGFSPSLWEQERSRAQNLHEQALANLGESTLIWGADEDSRMLDLAHESLEALGAPAHSVQLMQADLTQMQSVAPRGLLVANPPWGHRMGSFEEAQDIYARLGERLRSSFLDWHYAILAGDPALGSQLGIHAPKRVKLENAKLPMQLLLGEVHPRFFKEERKAKKAAEIQADPALANRLRKRKKQLKSWVNGAKVEAYRLYDADLPEYALAIDYYGDDIVVHEYKAPKEIPVDKARARLKVALETLRETLDQPAERIFLRKRARQRGSDQYERMRDRGVERHIKEGPAKFIVNLSDYLDTGLFLDHRMVRQEVAKLSVGKSLLNLFCYTATATVQAALAGARRSLSVDMSTTYLDWAERNFELNRLDPQQHRLLRADCLVFLEKCRDRFDVVFLDPPTFSNSKRMEDTLDVQRDHLRLIEGAMACLRPGGTLVFSCNARRFRMDPAIEQRFAVEDWSEFTTPPDFARKAHRRHCFKISASAPTKP